jgi:hypothetical protein
LSSAAAARRRRAAAAFRPSSYRWSRGRSGPSLFFATMYAVVRWYRGTSGAGAGAACSLFRLGSEGVLSGRAGASGRSGGSGAVGSGVGAGVSGLGGRVDSTEFAGLCGAAASQPATACAAWRCGDAGVDPGWPARSRSSSSRSSSSARAPAPSTAASSASDISCPTAAMARSSSCAACSCALAAASVRAVGESGTETAGATTIDG